MKYVHSILRAQSTPKIIFADPSFYSDCPLNEELWKITFYTVQFKTCADWSFYCTHLNNPRCIEKNIFASCCPSLLFNSSQVARILWRRGLGRI